MLDDISAHTMRRFTLRLTFLGIWALAGRSVGTVTFSSLTLISAIVCVLIALTAREHISRHFLNHWDEAAGYFLLYAIANLSWFE